VKPPGALGVVLLAPNIQRSEHTFADVARIESRLQTTNGCAHSSAVRALRPLPLVRYAKVLRF
jgi:hypothetical protein